jgi:hypothetical protein
MQARQNTKVLQALTETFGNGRKPSESSDSASHAAGRGFESRCPLRSTITSLCASIRPRSQPSAPPKAGGQDRRVEIGQIDLHYLIRSLVPIEHAANDGDHATRGLS